jgi:phage portal protein BeeE
LLYEHDAVVRRVELLKSLGYPEAHEMVLKASTVLNFKAETVREHDAWWKQTGLDHVKIITMNPTLLGVAPVEALQEKLNFLRDVSWLSTDDLNNGGPFFQASLDNKLRPRFFYAWKHGALERNKLSSLTFCSSAVYLRKVHQLDAPADEDAVTRFKETVASADFQAWAAQEEEARRQASSSTSSRT